MRQSPTDFDGTNRNAEALCDRGPENNRSPDKTDKGTTDANVFRPPSPSLPSHSSNNGVHDSAPNTIGPSVGYTDLLDYEIQEKLKTEAAQYKAGTNPRRSNPLRPSSAGTCARRLAYELNQYRGNASYDQVPRSPETYRLLELGHSVEFAALRTFQLLKVCEQKYKQQVLTFFEIERITPDLEKEVVEGSCDIVFWSKNYKSVADVKSKKDGFSAAYKTRWDEDTAKFAQMKSLRQLSTTAFYADDLTALIAELGDDFFTDNLYQLNLYACSEFMRSRGIDHAFIYQYNKNDSRHREIRFKPDVRCFEVIRQKFNRVAKAIDEKNLEAVGREYNLGSLRCSLCPFKGECWPTDDPTKAFFQTLPKKVWPQDVQESDRLYHEIKNYEEIQDGLKVSETLEASIIKEMIARGLGKIRLPNQKIYELKFLKSPRPHFELRRGKI